ncbi:MAG: VOC family protein [Acidobacteriota bacterium]|nr:MAG: VOC family protein [Acidobacteriota bacterium]
MSQADQDKRIDYIEFPTTSIGTSKAFYADVFGWRFTDWGNEYSSFEDGRLAGGLRLVDAVEAGGPLVVIYALHLEAMQAKIEHSGGTIVESIFSFPGGRRFHFADPSGNVLAVWSDQEPSDG